MGEISLALCHHVNKILIHHIFLILRDALGIIHIHLNFIFTSFVSRDGYCHTYKHVLGEMVLYYIWKKRVSNVWVYLISLYQLEILFFFCWETWKEEWGFVRWLTGDLQAKIYQIGLFWIIFLYRLK